MTRHGFKMDQNIQNQTYKNDVASSDKSVFVESSCLTNEFKTNKKNWGRGTIERIHWFKKTENPLINKALWKI